MKVDEKKYDNNFDNNTSQGKNEEKKLNESSTQSQVTIKIEDIEL